MYLSLDHFPNMIVLEFQLALQVLQSRTRRPKKDILVVQGDWNAKLGEEACKDWKGTCGHQCNTKSNDRGRQLLEFASYNNLVVANTFGPHKTSIKITWHSPDGKTHNQSDYIMVKKRFKTSVNICQDPKLRRSRHWKRP